MGFLIVLGGAVFIMYLIYWVATNVSYSFKYKIELDDWSITNEKEDSKISENNKDKL